MTGRRYTLFILTSVFAINTLDRHILSITLDQIGTEFSLTDTQLGLLSGLVFVAVYVLVGFPVAYLAAKGNRRNIIAISVAIWSSLTIAIAGAQSFAQLALARLGVGIGEAGAVAPAHSMISDLYPEDRRTSAMASFVSGANIGVFLAFLVGGVLGQAWGWRWAFVIAGLPGLVLAVLLRFTVSEPRRMISDNPQTHGSHFLAALRRILSDKGLLHAMIGISVLGVVTFGALAWNATIIIRTHGLSQAQTGIFLACVIGIGGAIGTWTSGRIADALGRRDARWRIGVVIVAIIASKPLIAGFLIIENTTLALTSMAGAAAMASVFWGPTFAFAHSRIDPELRPMVTAIFLFCFNLLGAGIGPTVIGLLSDTMVETQGARALPNALLVVQIAGLWAVVHYVLAMRQIKPTSHQASRVGISAAS